MQRVLILAFLGATAGTALDHTHVATGTLAYAHPFLFDQAWWVPLLFMAAGLGIGLSHPVLDRLFRRPSRRGLGPSELVIGIVGLAVIWSSSGVFHSTPRVTCVVLALASLALWWGLDRTWQGLLIAAGTAVLGVFTEATLVRAGAFHYTMPDAGVVGSWLPWVYVAASVSVGNLGRWLAAREQVAAPASGLTMTT